MPFVKIEVTREAVTREQKRQLIKGVTDVITNVLNKDPFLTHSWQASLGKITSG